MDEVNLGSQEQARGIDQISKAIVQMEQVTQQTAATAEESAAAAEELNAQSETLKAIVRSLSAMVGGGETSVGTIGHRRSPAIHHPAVIPQRAPQRLANVNPFRGSLSPQGEATALEPVSAGFKAGAHPFPLDEDLN